MERLRHALRLGLLLMDRIPESDPHGTAAARAVAAGKPPPTNKATVNEWVEDVRSLLADYAEWQKWFTELSFGTQVAHMAGFVGNKDHAEPLHVRDERVSRQVAEDHHATLRQRRSHRDELLVILVVILVVIKVVIDSEEGVEHVVEVRFDVDDLVHVLLGYVPKVTPR